MQVKELIAKLSSVSPDALVVIGGDVIHDIAIRTGSLEDGYYNPHFRPGKGKWEAVVFLANTEISTGEVVSAPK